MLQALSAAAATAAVLAACSSSGTSSTGSDGSTGTGSPAAGAAGSLKTATIGGVTVLTGARGFTLYSFAIKRSDASAQATFDGYPLYTFADDTAPGQAKGNGLNLNCGLCTR